jgi:hypothetical protein
MDRLVHTGLGSSSLVAHVLHYPPASRGGGQISDDVVIAHGQARAIDGGRLLATADCNVNECLVIVGRFSLTQIQDHRLVIIPAFLTTLIQAGRPVHSFKHLEAWDENREDYAQLSNRLIAVLWFQRDALTGVTS